MLGGTNVIGTKIEIFGQTGTVVGIIDDFYHRSLHHQVQPMVLADFNWDALIIVRIAPGSLQQATADMRKIWKRFSPERSATITVLADTYRNFYRNERQTGSVLQIFTGAMIFICLLGILGLSYYSIQRRTKEIAIRKSLVVFQFAAAAVLLIAVSVISGQMRYIRNKPLGYDKDCIISFAGYGKFGSTYESTRSELLKNADILNVDKSFPPNISPSAITDFEWEGKTGNKIPLVPIIAGFDFFKTFGMEIIEGRGFSRGFSTDSVNVVLNESAVRALGLKNPVGKRFRYNGEQRYIYGFSNEWGTIIGVVKDFHGGSLHSRIQPMAVLLGDGFFINAKISARNVPATIAFLETKWKDYVPGRPFRYTFLDEEIDKQYRAEQRIQKIFTVLTVLAMFISVLGLFSLASYMALQRSKEIGIRKILGASTGNLLLLLTKEFVILVLTANVIVWPLAWYGMNGWLQNFAYRITIGPLVFTATLAVSVAVAFISVGMQAFRSARSNPAESLRYE